MKLQFSKDKFSELFALAASTAATRDTRVILQNVKLEAREDQLILTATDGELGIRVETSEGISIEESGEILLPSRLFRQILQESLDKTLTLEQNGTITVITGEKGSRYQLPSPAVAEFPEIPPFSATSSYKVKGKILKAMIKHTMFATDIESSRYALGGVLLEFDEEKVSAVATDGRRLALQLGKVERQGEEPEEKSAVSPTKALSMVEKAATDDIDCQIALSSNALYFKIGNITFQTQLVNGRFPRWRTIIPSTEDKSRIDILAGSLLAVLRQVFIVTSDKESRIVKMHFSPGKLELTASGRDVGDAFAELPVSYDGPDTLIKVDPKYVMDFLAVLNQEEMVSLFFLEDVPILLRTSDDYNYVVMPLT